MSRQRSWTSTRKPRAVSSDERGYLLLSVMLLIAVMLIALAIEAPRISQQIKRDKEEELYHRGMEYAVAIKRFYHKNNTYPVSLEQLESTNNLRFLRRRYKDPLTAEGEWKLIHVGEAQVNLPAGTQGTPSATGSPAPGQSGTLNTSNPFASTPSSAPSPGGFGTSPGGGFGASPGPGGLNPGGAQGGNPPGTSQLGTLTVQSIGQGGGPIIGVASTSKKTSIKEFNGNAEYDQWLFVYDPKWEQVPGRAGVFVAAPVGSNPAGGTAAQGAGTQSSPAPGTTPQGNPSLPR